MNEVKFKTRILRILWGLFPWLLVGGIVAFIVTMGGRIQVEKVRMAEAKKAAIKKETPAVRVITLTLEPRRLTDKINLPAQVEPYEDLWVKAEVPGQVMDIQVKEGQVVKKGRLLARLDDRDYVSRLRRIEANYKLAKADYDRIATLARKKITPENQLDEIEAKLSDLRAQRAEAELALSRTRVVAPIGGRINEIKAKEGDLLSAGQPVAQILQFGQVKVTVGVPESDVASVFDLQEADVVIEALGQKRVRGRKVFLASQPRSLARLYDLELLLQNPDGHVLPGMFARVELVKQVFREALAVPLYAVISEGTERFVYVEEDGKAEKRPVELGVLIDWEVQVKAGLKPGDRVIVVGQRLLDAGQAVDVMKNVRDASEILTS